MSGRRAPAAPTYASLLADGWKQVVHSAEVDPDTDECPGCGGGYTDCPCPRPTMDDHEYQTVADARGNEVLMARPEANAKVLARLQRRFLASRKRPLTR